MLSLMQPLMASQRQCLDSNKPDHFLVQLTLLCLLLFMLMLGTCNYAQNNASIILLFYSGLQTQQKQCEWIGGFEKKNKAFFYTMADIVHC